MTRFTLLDETTPVTVDATVEGDRVMISDLEPLGWTLKPEGLCRGPVCLPARGLVDDGRVDLHAFADALGRPLALDVEDRVAALGASAADRAARLTSLDAPDFTLPDVHGVPHTLSQYRGRKVFLIAYASW